MYEIGELKMKTNNKRKLVVLGIVLISVYILFNVFSLSIYQPPMNISSKDKFTITEDVEFSVDFSSSLPIKEVQVFLNDELGRSESWLVTSNKKAYTVWEINFGVKEVGTYKITMKLTYYDVGSDTVYFNTGDEPTYTVSERTFTKEKTITVYDTASPITEVENSPSFTLLIFLISLAVIPKIIKRDEQ